MLNQSLILESFTLQIVLGVGPGFSIQWSRHIQILYDTIIYRFYRYICYGDLTHSFKHLHFFRVWTATLGLAVIMLAFLGLSRKRMVFHHSVLPVRTSHLHLKISEVEETYNPKMKKYGSGIWQSMFNPKFTRVNTFYLVSHVIPRIFIG